ncbi:MAG: transposase [Planctomycetota bacterium]
MYNILSRISNASSIETRIVLRARIIVLAYEKLSNIEIGSIVGLGRHSVGRWRKRWQASYEALLSVQLNEPHAALVRAIEDVFRDAHRSGAPCKFSAEQVVQLVSIACEDPRSSDRPVEDWTGVELADEMQKRGVVDSISVSRVNELLRLVNLQPHRRKCWCFTTEKDHCLFQSQVESVCQTYLEASAAYQLSGRRTVCVDEMTSLQANEHRARTLRSIPGTMGRCECQYTRHGTLSLTGSWDVVLGKMIKDTIQTTRDAEDFARHIEQTIGTDAEAEWVFVLDNLNTHYGEPLVRMVAKLLGIPEDSLGDKKRRKGILGNVKSRREFLSNGEHRIRFVFTPKHSSWLNQIEVIFGIISRRVMRHGSFTSKDDLEQKLTSFIGYFNETFATPMNWTYDGKPTKNNGPQRPRTWREKTQDRKTEKILRLVV